MPLRLSETPTESKARWKILPLTVVLDERQKKAIEMDVSLQPTTIRGTPIPLGTRFRNTGAGDLWQYWGVPQSGKYHKSSIVMELNDEYRLVTKDTVLDKFKIVPWEQNRI